jgi:hypothetical protein
LASREAAAGRTEREGRYGIEDQRYEDALALESERYADTINRQHEDLMFRRQIEGLAASRGVAALEAGDPNYEVTAQERAVIDRMLGGVTGSAGPGRPLYPRSPITPLGPGGGSNRPVDKLVPGTPEYAAWLQEVEARNAGKTTVDI